MKNSIELNQERNEKSIYGQLSQAPLTVFVKESPDAEEIELPLSEIEARFGINWTETVFTDNELVEQPISNEDLLVEEKLKKILTFKNSLGLVNMGEPVGYCLYARKDIPRDTCVTTYGGDLYQDVQSASGRYTMSFFKAGEATQRAAIDGEKRRNFGGFLTHLPKNKSHLTFHDKKDESSLSVQNVRREIYNYRGHPIVAVKTCRPVRKDSLLGYDYWPACETVTPAHFSGLKIMDSNKYTVRQPGFFDRKQQETAVTSTKISLVDSSTSHY